MKDCFLAYWYTKDTDQEMSLIIENDNNSSAAYKTAKIDEVKRSVSSAQLSKT